MKFKQALQALCDEHNVKLMVGIVLEKDRHGVRLMAYKLSDDGRVAAAQELPPIISPARKP